MTMAVVDGDKRRRRKEGNLKETLWRIRERIKEPSNGILQKKEMEIIWLKFPFNKNQEKKTLCTHTQLSLPLYSMST